MPRTERWGRPYPVTRDWSIYNELLVKRGEFYLSLDFIDRWDDHLSQMNAGKRGRPFQYPESFIAWMASIHTFLQMPYRQMEGFARRLAPFIPGLKAADYTTLFRRIQHLDLSLPVVPELLAEDVIVAADSTGIKVTNRGEWIREKWRVSRGWIKLHVMIDVETNQVIGLEITDESVLDDQMFIPLLDQVQQHGSEEHPVYRVLADVPTTGTNSSTPSNSGGSPRASSPELMPRRIRPGHPIALNMFGDRNRWSGYPMWSRVVTYGMQWKAEGFFSGFKRIFGEGVQATSQEGMFRDIG